MVIALAVTLIGGVTLGGGALAMQAASSSGTEGGGTNAVPPSPSAPAPGGGGGNTQQPITQEQFTATRPRNVRLQPFTGRRAVLSWTVPPAARKLPIIVQALPEGSAPTVSAGQGARSATVSGLRPGSGYCFRVGALLRLNQGRPATISWSRPPVCVGGAGVRPP